MFLVLVGIFEKYNLLNLLNYKSLKRIQSYIFCVPT